MKFDRPNWIGFKDIGEGMDQGCVCFCVCVCVFAYEYGYGDYGAGLRRNDTYFQVFKRIVFG